MKRLIELCGREENPAGLAIFRVGTGLVLTWTLLSAAANGAVQAVWVELAGGGEGPLGPWTLWGLALAGALLTLAGAGGPVGPLLALFSAKALFALHPASGGGHDRLITAALWLLALSPAARTLSLDCWLRTRKWVDPTPRPAWTRLLAALQLTAVYTATGVQKVGTEWFIWGDLDAVRRALLLPSWARFDLAPILPKVRPLLQLATQATWIFEVAWPLVFAAVLADWRGKAWRFDPRAAFLLFGVSLHVGIAAAMELGPFSWITLSYYACLWSGDQIARRISPLR